MKRFTMLLLLTNLALGTLAHAELYRWVDEQGTLHFTEEYGSIPKKYRSSVQSSEDSVTTGDGSSLQPMPGEKGAVKAEKTAVTGSVEGKPQQAALFGGKRGEVWRDELRQSRAELKAYQDHLQLKRKMLADTTGMGRREYLGLTSDVKELELKVQELTARHDALQRAADKAGVPPAFR